MHRTEGTNNVANQFADGPPGTTVEEDWLNAVQEELANVIEGAGFTLKSAATETRNQLLASVVLKTGDTMSGPLGVNTINEATASAGVTVDGFLLRDGSPAPLIWPTFSVHKNVGAQAINQNAWTKVSWTTAEWDTNTNFAANAFTPTPGVTSRFLLTTSVNYTTIDTDVAIQIAIYKNGVLFKEVAERTNTGSSQGVDITCIVTANGSTDYFEVYTRHESAAPKSVSGIIATCFFQGSRIA